jgi:hypothetical protein
VYFAVLKYLGFENLNRIQLSQVTILPPILYLAALILYGLALRPTFKPVSKEGFPAFRESRLIYLNRFLTAGTLVFVGATGLAVVMFFFRDDVISEMQLTPP